MTGGRFSLVLLLTLFAFAGGGYLIHSAQDERRLGSDGDQRAPLAATGSQNSTPPGATGDVVGTDASSVSDKQSVDKQSASVQPGADKADAPAGVPGFDAIEGLDSGTLVLAGTAMPNALVTVFVDGDPIATVKADAAGSWMLIEERVLSAGKHILSLVARAADSPETSVSGQTLEVQVGKGGAAKAVASGEKAIEAAPGSDEAVVPPVSKRDAASPDSVGSSDVASSATAAQPEDATRDLAAAPSSNADDAAPGSDETSSGGGVSDLIKRTEELASAATEKFTQWLKKTGEPEASDNASTDEEPTSRERAGEDRLALNKPTGATGDATGGQSDRASGPAQIANNNPARENTTDNSSDGADGAAQASSEGKVAPGDTSDATDPVETVEPDVPVDEAPAATETASGQEGDGTGKSENGVEGIIKKAGEVLAEAGERVKVIMGEPADTTATSGSASTDAAASNGSGTSAGTPGDTASAEENSADAGNSGGTAAGTVAATDEPSQKSSDQNSSASSTKIASNKARQDDGSTTAAESTEKEPSVLEKARQSVARVMQGNTVDPNKSQAKTERALLLDQVSYRLEDGVAMLAISGEARPDISVEVRVGETLLGVARSDRRGKWSLDRRIEITPGLYDLKIGELDEAGKLLDEIAYRYRVAPFAASVAGKDGAGANQTPTETAQSGIVQPGTGVGTDDSAAGAASETEQVTGPSVAIPSAKPARRVAAQSSRDAGKRETAAHKRSTAKSAKRRSTKRKTGKRYAKKNSSKRRASSTRRAQVKARGMASRRGSGIVSRKRSALGAASRVPRNSYQSARRRKQLQRLRRAEHRAAVRRRAAARRLAIERKRVRKLAPRDRQSHPPSYYRRTAPAASRSSRWHRVRRGDTLWAIARRYYGRGACYRRIHRANRSKIRNPHRIYPRQVFLIPALRRR